MCEHHDATLLWLYGEGPEDQAVHVARCAACRAVVEEHEGVATALAPVMGALRRPAAPRRRRWPWAAVALAAAALLAVWVWPSGEVRVVTADVDPLEPALDDLDLELTELELELL